MTGSRSGWRRKWKKGRWKGQEEKKRKKRMWGVLFTISLFNVLSLKTHKHSQRMYLELTRWYFLQKNSWLWHMCVCALSATLMLIGQSCDLWWTYVFRGQFVDFLCALYLLHNLHKQKNVHECNTLSFSSVFSLPGEICGFVGSGFSNNFFTEKRCWQKSDVKLKINRSQQMTAPHWAWCCRSFLPVKKEFFPPTVAWWGCLCIIVGSLPCNIKCF